MIDQPTPLREEDAWPLEPLTAWLAQHGVPGVPQVAQFAGGASNLTYLLTYPGRELVLRTPPRGTKAASSHDMGRECRVMAGLAGLFPVPEIVAQCSDSAVIGAPFYVMERIRGVILRADPPPDLDLNPAVAAGLAERMIELLVQLHNLRPLELGLGDLDRGPGYVARQVSGWNQRYRAAALPGSPDATAVMDWLQRRQPPDLRRCLIHNDWRLDNLILDPTDPQVVLAVLDWEMATIGDPLMDLGAALAYWVQADDDPLFLALRRQPTHLAGMPTRAEVFQRYGELAGVALAEKDRTFYEVFGLFRLAVIAQQIHYRFAAGQTSNPALAGFAAVVAGLVDRCQAAIRG